MQVANTNNKCFIIWSSKIEGRFDPHFYKPDFITFLKELGGEKIKVVKLGEIIKSIINGFDYRKFSDKGLSYLRVANIKPETLNLENVKKIDIDPVNKAIQLEVGSVLLTRKGTFGVSICIPKKNNYVISSEIFKIETKENINPRFLSIVLNSRIGQKQFNRVKIGAIMGSLSQEAVKEILIPLPDLKTQNKIVEIMQLAYEQKASKEQEAKNILNSIDDYILGELGVKISKIENKKCFFVNYEEMKNQRIDPFFYQPKYQAITKSLNKSKFPIKKLEDLCLVEWGNTNLTKRIYKEKGYPAFSASGQDGYLDFYEHNENAVILSAIGARCGKCFLARGKWTAIKNTIIIKPVEQTKINIIYLYIFLNNENLWEKSGGAQPFITMKSANNLKIPFPPIEIQEQLANEFGSRLEKANKLKAEAKNEIEKAKQEVEKIILGI